MLLLQEVGVHFSLVRPNLSHQDDENENVDGQVPPPPPSLQEEPSKVYKLQTRYPDHLSEVVAPNLVEVPTQQQQQVLIKLNDTSTKSEA